MKIQFDFRNTGEAKEVVTLIIDSLCEYFTDKDIEDFAEFLIESGKELEER